ncbi:hypothetical protein PAXRUDRAFT_825962 [Paxillus rubicundulus Ve08.2h10]|uniref:DUF6534 domain-containing protein n=1 Tax=Paxillus rubicundulus Ve08.2h10 TaxID=930991 RepID=A0A0D0DSJ4_9AGAM|nr:hypothetical protein PAXRUDRAFT_825962 [Paxillus rubicundulus Ve08.2h10]
MPAGGFFWLGFSIIADIMIAGSLCYILNKNRTGFASTERMIKRLMRFCVQTGLIMSLAAGATLALWAAAKLDTDHLVMSFPMGGSKHVPCSVKYISRSSTMALQSTPRASCQSQSFLVCSVLSGSLTFFSPSLIARESYFHPRVTHGDTELITVSRRSMAFVRTEDIERNPRESPESAAPEQPPQGRTSVTFSDDGSATAEEL